MTPLSACVERSHTDALAYAGAVSCLEREAVHGTRAYIFFRADSDCLDIWSFAQALLNFVFVTLML
jgi:hypothetical protein